METPFEGKSAFGAGGTRLIMSLKLTLVLAYPTFYCLLRAVASGRAYPDSFGNTETVMRMRGMQEGSRDPPPIPGWDLGGEFAP